MVSNPFGGDNSIEVELQGDGSNLNSAISGAEKKMMGFRGAVAGVGGALGALAVGGLAKSASAAMDFEQAMADVEKVTNAETAEALSEPIQDMAEDLPLAAEELSALAADAGRFGAEGAEEIESFTRTAAEMGAATQLSSDEAAQSLAKVATALDEPLENVDMLGDSINELSNNFATDSQEIVDAAQRGGFAVQEMGLSSDEILGLSAAMNEVAPTSRQAATMMEQMGESMTDPDNVAGFAEALGVTEDRFREMREESPDETLLAVSEAMEESDEASQILSDTLSTQQTRAFGRLGQQSDQVRDAMQQSNEAMEEGGSLAREVAIETDTFQGQMKLLRSQVNNVFREIGENLLPVLTDLMSHVSAGVDGFSALNDRTNGMAGAAALAGTAVGGFAVALAALVGPVGAIVAGFGTLLAPLATVAGLFAGLAAPILTAGGAIATFLAPLTGLVSGLAATLGPIGLLIAAIGVLGFAFKEHRGVIIRFANQAIGILTDVIRDAANWIQANGPDMIGRAFEAIGEGIRFVALDIYNAITGNGDSLLKSIIIDAGTWLVNNGPGILKSAAETAFEVIMAAARGLYKGLIGNSLFPEMFADIATYIKGTAKGLLTGAIDTLIEGAKNGFDYLTGTGGGTLLGDIKSTLGDVIDWIQNDFSITSTLKSVFDGAGEAAAGGFESAFNAVIPSSIDLPSREIGGREIGGGSLDLPQLDTGGFIEEAGVAQLHAGERVLNPAETRQLEEGGGTQKIRLVLDERTDVVEGRIEEGAERVVVDRERRTQRNTGRNLSPR